MNCKPGDLAVIVSVLNPVAKFLIGTFVEVLETGFDPAGPAWLVRLNREITNPITGERGDIGVALDVHLRPIRDPGDDAQDEMLRPLPEVANA